MIKSLNPQQTIFVASRYHAGDSNSYQWKYSKVSWSDTSHLCVVISCYTYI